MTLVEIAQCAVAGKVYCPKEFTKATDSSKVIQTLSGATTAEISQRVEECVQGKIPFQEFEKQVNGQNAYQYLAAARKYDLVTGTSETFEIRRLCALKSEVTKTADGKVTRHVINMLNAFTNPPANLEDLPEIIINEVDNTHPGIVGIHDEASKRQLLGRVYQYSQEQALIIPRFVPVIMQIMQERLEGLLSVAKELPPKTSIFFGGGSGGGKSHALKIYLKEKVPHVPMTQAVYSTDHLKLDLRTKTGDVFSDFQAFLLALGINKELMKCIRVTHPGLSLIQEGWLTNTVVETLFKDLNQSKMRLDMREFDGDFFALCLRVLSRHNDPTSPKTPFEDIKRGFIGARDARTLLYKLKRDEDILHLEYVQNDHVVLKNKDPKTIVYDPKLLDLEITEAKNALITEKHVQLFGESIRPFVGQTIFDALNARK